MSTTECYHVDTMSSSSFTSRCPGAVRWRTLSDGKIEVEGLGVPYASSTDYSSDAKFIPEVWNKWKSEIQAASAETGIPEQWILALIVIESRGKNYPPNSAGAGGLMGMMIQATSIGLGRKATAADVADPATNIRAGAGFMAYNGRQFGMELPTIAVAHNAGSPKCSPNTRCKNTIDGAWTFDGTQAANSMGMVEDCIGGRGSGYALRAVKINNSAIDLGIGGAKLLGFDEGVVVAIAGAAFVGALYWAFPKEVDEVVDHVTGLFSW